MKDPMEGVKAVFEGGDMLELVQYVREEQDDDLDHEAVALAKDHGLYFMARDREHGPIYADGCHPEKDEDFYLHTEWIAGGDDFVEFFELSFMEKLVENIESDDILVLEFTPSNIKFSYPKAS